MSATPPPLRANEGDARQRGADRSQGTTKQEAPANGRGFLLQWSSDQRWITRRSVVV